ncbi:DeoR/GlpR family DNA-binding transcription regulator [Clostridium sp.]|jgi:DeoR/GlpR family transcriptional regulator of sugar metabolism|uniref:DeoR/GlpR family DNA-binding transcription regulator n=1 Tax=Clostridium sp. TaxID=1506 RepID=UPI003EE8210B
MNERQNEIFDILSKKPKVTVIELSKMLRVSEVTIRKDLTALENQGLLKRTHGGATQIASNSIEKRMRFRYEEKLRIVKEAVKLIANGETILIEAGSTNALLAIELADNINVHIITNSVFIAYSLNQYENVKLTVIGGEFQSESEAMVGPLTNLCLSKICVDKAFISMDGFSEKLGFTCGDFLRAEVGKKMCQRAETVIILAESSKFDNTGITSVTELSNVSIVITDKDIAQEKVNILQKHNIQTIIV